MIGNQIIHLDRVDSTSNYVATLVSEGKARHGVVILAEKQTNGRGQRGAEWQSENSKNLLLSFYLEHNQFEIIQQEALTHFVSLAIQACLSKFKVKSNIKWPNDILVGTKKIAGILIENQLRGNQISSSIIGIGLNVAQKTFEFLGSTSMAIEASEINSKDEVFKELIFQLNEKFELIRSKQFSKLKKEYLKSLWLLGKESIYESNGEKFMAILRGTAEFGRLQLERDNILYVYDLKEIKFNLRNAP